MPLHLKHYQTDRQDHFITFSCHGRLPYLNTEVARELFLRSLASTQKTYALMIYGYVIMPEHVHLLITEPTLRPLSSAIQALKLSVAKQSLHKPLWLPRYYDRNIRNATERTDVLAYLHQNPVKRGLVSSPEDWPWSSFRHHQLHEANPIVLTNP